MTEQQPAYQPTELETRFLINHVRTGSLRRGLSLLVDDLRLGTEVDQPLTELDNKQLEMTDLIKTALATPPGDSNELEPDVAKAIDLMPKLDKYVHEYRESFQLRPISIGQEINFCKAWLFCARYTFWKAIWLGWSMEKLDVEIEWLTDGSPDNPPVANQNLSLICWRARTRIQQLSRLEDEVLQMGLRDTFNESVTLEWVDPPPDFADFSTRIPSSGPFPKCMICLEEIGAKPGITLTVCTHSFCEECLGVWINQCSQLSHTCPLCRAELFQPKYQPVADQPNSTPTQRSAIEYMRGNKCIFKNILFSALSLEFEMRRHAWPGQDVAKKLVAGGIADYIFPPNPLGNVVYPPYHPDIGAQLTEGKINHWTESNLWPDVEQHRIDPWPNIKEDAEELVEFFEAGPQLVQWNWRVPPGTVS